MYRTRSEWLEVIRRMPSVGPGIRGTDFLDTAYKHWEDFSKRLELPLAGTVLDIGCGFGRMAVEFIDCDDVKYIGVDILPEVIQWADEAFKPWSNIRFYCSPVSNGMYKPVGLPPMSFTLEEKDKSVELILALSLFTHLASLEVTERYFSEMMRVLKPKGHMITSWFFSPPNRLCFNPDRTVVSASWFLELINKYGLKVVDSWGGTSLARHDQTVVILKAA